MAHARRRFYQARSNPSLKPFGFIAPTENPTASRMRRDYLLRPTVTRFGKSKPHPSGKPCSQRLRNAPLRFQLFKVQSSKPMKQRYTAKQGQYLAFIYYYNKIHGCSPSEAEMQQYFRVSPPSVHQMTLTLEANGLIERTPGQARSIRLLIPREELPDLV